MFLARIQLLKSKAEKEKTEAVISESPRCEKLMKGLPYELTGAQKRAIEDISRDMSSGYCMNRLVQGDVGCGKTAVAFISAMKMIDAGFGRIVNTTSGIALDPHQAAYSASKAALDKITVDLGSTVEGTDVMINLTDPGWCRTDLGGPQAPNPPESALPGLVVGAFVDDGKSGRLFAAQEYTGLTFEEAVKRAES